MSLSFAIMASGNGTNAEAMFRAIENGKLDAKVTLVLSNRPGAGIEARAEQHGVPFLCLDHTAYPDRAAFDRAAVEAIRRSGADTVVLAGYMRLLTPEFLEAFPNRVLNIHPALLPSFKGVHGARDAVDWGVRVSGCTVHFVSPEMDCGPVIIQACVPVMQGETGEDLQDRIHAQEHRIYPQALQWLAQGRLAMAGRRVEVTPFPQGQRSDNPPPVLIWPPLDGGF